MAIAAALAGPDAAHATTDTTFGSPRDPWRMEGVGEPVRAGRPGLALLGRRSDAGGEGLADGAVPADARGFGARGSTGSGFWTGP